MSTHQEQELAALRHEIQDLRDAKALGEDTDNGLEVAIRDQLNLGETVAGVAPLLHKHLGADRVWVRTYDDNLELRDFFWTQPGAAAWPLELPDLLTAVEAQSPLTQDHGQSTLVAQLLDVAGETFGVAALCVPQALSPEATVRVAELFNTWCEHLDNHLAFIALARNKHHIVGALSSALRQPVLGDGIVKALELLKRHIQVDDMVLVYRREDDDQGRTLSYWVLRDGELIYDQHSHQDDPTDAFMATHGITMLLKGQADAMASHFGLKGFREEVLINGVHDRRVVGRMLVSRKGGQDFSTFERDLLERFADFLRQRIVDFNREWRHLALAFPDAIASRLLTEEHYVDRYLRPSEQNVAILYCDIAGFTRVSEQILQQPALIGRLVDKWSAEVVQMIWDSGGVFDKMVGDCIIGLWGPPYFEMPAQQACLKAAQTAQKILTFTNSLTQDPELPDLLKLEKPLSVATGLNYCPLFVGLFGPNENYTGFSSGMNNTARLQGVAERDEILCMEAFVKALGDAAQFSEPRQAKVKNVAAPLRFRALLDAQV